jgi:hypothetical protein
MSSKNGPCGVRPTSIKCREYRGRWCNLLPGKCTQSPQQSFFAQTLQQHCDAEEQTSKKKEIEVEASE